MPPPKELADEREKILKGYVEANQFEDAVKIPDYYLKPVILLGWIADSFKYGFNKAHAILSERIDNQKVIQENQYKLITDLQTQMTARGINALYTQIATLESDLLLANKDIASLSQQLAVAEEALRFYADWKSWEEGCCGLYQKYEVISDDFETVNDNLVKKLNIRTKIIEASNYAETLGGRRAREALAALRSKPLGAEE